MTKIACIADTHGLHGGLEVPECDILICAGDITAGNSSKIFYVEDFAYWFSSQPAKHHVTIAGNHDWAFVEHNKEARAALENVGIVYLQDQKVELEGLLIYGSPWQPWFHDWAFNLQRGHELRNKWALIPDNVNILVTHGPPFGILDVTNRMQGVGCEDLARRIKRLGYLQAHIFGHIHEGYGRYSLEDEGQVVYVNASTCDDYYSPCNPPIVIEV